MLSRLTGIDLALDDCVERCNVLSLLVLAELNQDGRSPLASFVIFQIIYKKFIFLKFERNQKGRFVLIVIPLSLSLMLLPFLNFIAKLL